MIYLFESETQSYNLCEWCGDNKYCSLVTGKIFII